MTSRIVWLSLALVLGFVWLTGRAGGPIAQRPAANEPAWTGPGTVHGAGLTADEQNNIDVYRAAREATVYITSTVEKATFWEVYQTRELGSGLIVDDSGRILTNHHVISGSRQVEVTLPDRSKYTADILERNRDEDLALIQIHAGRKLPFLRLGDSDRLQVGQKVLAIGNPFGLELTLTTGVVSSLGRNLPAGGGERELEGMIQTDAAINSGNSGGPLLDSQGNVVGINTAILGPNGNIGIGFAMPINRAKTLLSDFRAGLLKAGFVGVTVVRVTGELAQALGFPQSGGLLVQGIEEHSPAAKAGVRGPRQVVWVGGGQLRVGGDLIVAVDGAPVDRNDAIARAMAHKHAGDYLTLTVLRNSKPVDLKARLGEARQDVP